MSFFGFDTTMPGRSGPGNGRFANADDVDLFANGAGVGAQEDIAVYTWGADDYDGLGDALIEGGDEANDMTFGDAPIGNDFVFSHHQNQPQQGLTSKPKTTLSMSSSRTKRAGKKAPVDLFASTEADFFSTPKKSSARIKKPLASLAAGTTASSSSDSLNKMAGQTALAAPAQQTGSQPQVRTLAEIEAEMLAQGTTPPASSAPPSQTRPMTMEELEREMMQNARISAPSQPTPGSQVTPTQAQIAAQELSNTMFPPLGSAPPAAAPLQQDPSQLGAMQQQLLASLGAAPAGMPGPGQALPPAAPQPTPEELEAFARKADEKRKRKAQKIVSMAKYNDIMTGGDKEFITRIQLSQLVTPDPYSSDFYAQVFTQVARAKAAAAGVPVAGPTVVQVGSDGRGLSVNTLGRSGQRIRESAMQRMTMQVKRIVENANARKAAAPSASLQGALGTIKGRSTATGPRQALQVAATAGQAQRASDITNLLNNPTGSQERAGDRHEPLTRKQVMIKLEALYEAVLEIEQLRRQQPPPPPTEQQQREVNMSNDERQFYEARFMDWQGRHQTMVDALYAALMIQEPLEISDPHPFISLLTPIKGHRLLNRVMRHFSEAQALTVVILLLACYPQLDVVRHAPPWLYASSTVNVFSMADMENRKRKLKETESYLGSVYPIIVGVLGRLDLKMLAGMVSLCLERWDVVQVLSTRPGTALFTAILSRADMLRRPENAGVNGATPPSTEDQLQWSQAMSSLVQTIAPRLTSIFPSTQAQNSAFGPALSVLPGGVQGTAMGTSDEQEGLYMDAMDGEVWGVLASLAIQTPQEEQPLLVSSLREKVRHRGSFWSGRFSLIIFYLPCRSCTRYTLRASNGCRLAEPTSD